MHADPLSLIEKVLDQNPKSYTKLDDLLFIGRNFVSAGLISSPSVDEAQSQPYPLSQDQIPIIAERRIISMAVSSALESDDFGTAYSYIMTRLTPSSLLPTSTTTNNTTSPVEEDISWRAAYNAGRYRSNTSEADLAFQINNLSQRMELLSLALILAPSADPLPEVLGAWRRCDEEMSNLRDREMQEAEDWDTRGDRSKISAAVATNTVPGGFGPSDRDLDAYENAQQSNRRSQAFYNYSNHNKSSTSASGSRNKYDEEAPMGLFDVARGAARAFGKNLTPLQQLAASRASQHEEASMKEEGGLERSRESLDSSSSSTERVRKRDVVSNMVTGGLASGLGWVLGAQPVNKE